MAQVAAVCDSDGNRQTVAVRHGRIIWQGDDVEHRHLVWSCTKSYMSACLGMLWDDGKCSPTILAASVLPGLAADYPGVTLGHLATFTSGYNHATDRPQQPAKPLYKPGEAYCHLWPSAPPSTFAAQGNRNNLCIIIPEWDLVVVRLGEDKIIDIGLFDAALLYLSTGMREAEAGR